MAGVNLGLQLLTRVLQEWAPFSLPTRHTGASFNFTGGDCDGIFQKKVGYSCTSKDESFSPKSRRAHCCNRCMPCQSVLEPQ